MTTHINTHTHECAHTLTHTCRQHTKGDVHVHTHTHTHILIILQSWLYIQERTATYNWPWIHAYHCNAHGLVFYRFQFHYIQIPLAMNLIIDHARAREPFQVKRSTFPFLGGWKIFKFVLLFDNSLRSIYGCGLLLSVFVYVKLCRQDNQVMDSYQFQSFHPHGKDWRFHEKLHTLYLKHDSLITSFSCNTKSHFIVVLLIVTTEPGSSSSKERAALWCS